MPHQTSRPFLQAEGFLELGLNEEAWEALDQLPRHMHDLRPVIDIRIKILVSAGSWQGAKTLASRLIQADDRDAGAWYTIAQAEAQMGEKVKAQVALKFACLHDESLKLKALRDPLLMGVW